LLKNIILAMIFL